MDTKISRRTGGTSLPPPLAGVLPLRKDSRIQGFKDNPPKWVGFHFGTQKLEFVFSLWLGKDI